MALKSLSRFFDIAKSGPKKRVVVAAAEDETVLRAVSLAAKENLVIPILVGNRESIQKIAKQLNVDIVGVEIADANSPRSAVAIAVALINEGGADILMKGMVGTADFLRPILNKETGLRNGNLLNHIGFLEPPCYHKLIAVSDAALNGAPTLEEKICIINNCVEVFHKLGERNPKIACIAAVETVMPRMEATIHAALLTMMNRRRQIKDCIVDGPLGTDNAISKEAAIHKGIVSDVAGDADLLFCPDIEMGNAIYKILTCIGGATAGAAVVGAKVPIILTSRADSEQSKLCSIALACCL